MKEENKSEIISLPCLSCNVITKRKRSTRVWPVVGCVVSLCPSLMINTSQDNNDRQHQTKVFKKLLKN